MAAEQRITPVLLEVYIEHCDLTYMNSYKSKKDSYTKKFATTNHAPLQLCLEKALLKSFKDGIFEGTGPSLLSWP